MTTKFTGNVAELRKAARDRIDLEAAATGKVDGRTLRRKSRNQQLNIRVTPETRAEIEGLARVHGGLPFVDLMLRALAVLKAVGVEPAKAIESGMDPAEALSKRKK